MEYFIFAIVLMCFIVVMTLQYINKERLIKEKESLQNEIFAYHDKSKMAFNQIEGMQQTIFSLRDELHRVNNERFEEKSRTVVATVKEVFTLFELTALKEDPEQFMRHRMQERLIERILGNGGAIEFRTTKEDLSMHVVAEAKMTILKPKHLRKDKHEKTN